MPNNPVSLRPAFTNMQPPHNLEAEQALIACILTNNLAFERVRELITHKDFYHPVFGRIYEAMQQSLDAGQRADSVTLRRLFETDEEMSGLGGPDFLAHLAGSYVSIVNAADYGRLIAHYSACRKLQGFALAVVDIAQREEPPAEGPAALMEEVEAQLYHLSDRREVVGSAIAMPPLFDKTLSAIEDAYKHQGKSLGVPTGIKALDHKLGRMMPGNFIVLAGRPSMGKTAAGLSIARNVAGLGFPVLFQTMEMSEDEIMQRLIARETGISAERQQNGKLNSGDFDAVFEAGEGIKKLPLWIDDTARLTVPTLRSRVMRHKRQYGLRLLVIDYLGLMKPTRERQNKTLEIGEISNGLKLLAKELEIPILCLAQLSRANESRDDKRPQLSDLRDSGEIEQDADTVGFVYRDEYYLVKAEPKQRGNETSENFNARCEQWERQVEASRGKGEIIIAKRRNGETGTAKMVFDGLRCQYRDLDEVAA